MKMHIYLIALFLLINFCGLYPQQSEIDSLKRVLETSLHDTNRVQILNNLADVLITNNYGEAYKTASKALELAESINYETGILEALITLGQYYYIEGEYDNSVNTYIRAGKIAENKNLINKQIRILNSIAVTYSRMGNHEKTKESFLELMPLIEKRGSQEDKLMLYVNLGMAYGLCGDINKAEEYIKKTYSDAENPSIYKGGAANNLSMINFELGKYKEAIQFAEEAIDIAKKINQTELLIEAMTNLSNSKFKLGNYPEAIQIAENTVDIASGSGAKLQLQNSYGNLYLYHEASGTYKTALDYLKKYMELKDSLFNENMMNQITMWETKFQTERKEKEIAQKNEELSIASMKFYTVLIILGVFVISLLIVVNLYIKRDKAYKSLIQKNLDLSKSNILFQELKSDNENPILPLVDSEKENIVEPGEKYFGSTLSETKKSEINEKLLDLLNKEKIFMQKGISLEKVATLLEVNSKYVSQVINENFYVSFPVLLNDYRIKEAIKMLSDSQYAHYSIEGIANSVGFNSKSVFNNTFKKATGVTPSYFKNNIRNIVEKSA